MSKDQPVLTSLTESFTDVPVSAGQVENYVLLLVLLSVFAGGTLVLLSLLLLFCHRCCLGGRRYSRASDDPEKTNTTYAEDSQPTQEITIRLDESDALSALSCHEGESERFVATGSTGRRVSFNESALYDQEKMAQDKGRRYTLTEGDFHYLKKARLTHLHLPPPPCDLKILTIMECESTESSSTNINETNAPKPPLTIYQPGDRRVPGWVGQSLSGALPGDPHHSIVLDQDGRKPSFTMKTQHARPHTMEGLGDTWEANGEGGQMEESLQSLGQTSVLHFFSKLRRHASLEGAGPYFKKWKFDTSNRAASLDAKGSPKRKPFQRQRAASENTDHTEEDSSSLCDDAFKSFPQTPTQITDFQSLSAESLTHSAAAPSASVFLRSLDVESMVELGASINTGGEELSLPLRRTEDELVIEAGAEEQETVFGADVDTAAAEKDGLCPAEAHNLFERNQRGSTGAVEDNINTGKDFDRQQREGDEENGEDMVLGAEARQRTDSNSSVTLPTRQESLEAPPSMCRDIWSLRASLEQYASSDHSSTDRESIRSDADSVSSFGGVGARAGLDSCLSQDLDDEPDGEMEGETGGGKSVDSEMGNGAAEGEGGNRKLLQMDSGYASIEAPSRAPEEMRLFGVQGAPRGKTASERRLFFTNSGRKGSVCESVEARLFQEELEDQIGDSTDGDKMQSQKSTVHQEPYQLLKSLHPQKGAQSQHQLMSPLVKPMQPIPSPHRPRLRRRDYSIDEKTDALFNEFLRHDPRFDQQDSPLRSRHRSRVHLRKQWQRHKQYSDPGSASGGRYSPSLERQRFTPLRRGDSAGYPLDTRYHSTLSRIASAADEEASEVAASEDSAKEKPESKGQPAEGGATKKTLEGGNLTKTKDCEEAQGSQTGVTTEAQSKASTVSAQVSHMNPRVDNRNNNSSQSMLSEAESSLTDKLVASVDERLYGGLRRAEAHAHTESELAVFHTASPGFSPT